MNHLLIISISALACLGLAGCVESDGDPTPPAPAPGQGGTAPPSPWNMTILTGCKGVHMQQEIPRHLSPWPSPNGWEEDFRPTFFVYVEMYSCDRASVDGESVIENVSIGYEAHTNLNDNDQYWDWANYHSLQALGNWYTDSPQLQSLLSEIGLHATNASISTMVAGDLQGVDAFGEISWDGGTLETHSTSISPASLDQPRSSRISFIYRVVYDFESPSWIQFHIDHQPERTGAFSTEATGDAMYTDLGALGYPADASYASVDTTITIVRNGTGQL